MTWEWVVLIIAIAAIAACLISYWWSLEANKRREEILDLRSELRKKDYTPTDLRA